MKAKRVLTMLLFLVLTLAMTCSLVACGSKDTGADTKTESQQKDENKQAEEDAETPDPTATPEPTPTPEVLPTAEELMKANMDRFDDNVKTTIRFGYEGTDGTDKVTMRIDTSNSRYENVEYQNSEIFFEMMGYSETSREEVYYVDDEMSAMRTEYSYDTEREMWVKSEYAYIDLEEEEEDTENNPLEGLTNINVTKEGEFYYVTGDLDKSMGSDVTAAMGTDGASVAAASGKFKFEAVTKQIVGAEMIFQFNPYEEDGATINMDDCVVEIEVLTAPIVIPEEVLAAESDIDVDIDWEIIPDEEEEVVPEPEKYDESELPANWGTWYSEYNCKSGSFLMWSDARCENIPVTLHANENWYFDTQYKYTLYLAVNDPAIQEDGPAYEVSYSDSDALVRDPERGAVDILSTDYSHEKTLDDVVPIVCNNKQCFYLDLTSSDFYREFVVFQDIGMENYVEIGIETYDLTTDPLRIIEKFLLNITQSGGQEI